jgi:hypothetical protein
MPLRFAIVGAGIIGLATASEANGEVMGSHPLRPPDTARIAFAAVQHEI